MEGGQKGAIEQAHLPQPSVPSTRTPPSMVGQACSITPHTSKACKHAAHPLTCPAAGSEVLKACLLLAHAVEGHKGALQGSVEEAQVFCLIAWALCSQTHPACFF